MSASAEGDGASMLEHESDAQTEQTMASAFAQLDPIALGAGVGVLAASVIWFATATLLLQGGQLVGLHLRGLGHYLPGYDVSWLGSIVGAVEAGVLGFALGALLAWMWNAYHRWFMALAMAREVRRELQEL